MTALADLLWLSFAEEIEDKTAQIVQSSPIRLSPCAVDEIRASFREVVAEALLPTIALRDRAYRLAIEARTAERMPRNLLGVAERLVDVHEFDSDPWLEDFTLRRVMQHAANIGRALDSLWAHKAELMLSPGVGVASIEVLGSETHNGGCRPIALALTAGTTVVYKPVDSTLQRLFAQVSKLVSSSVGIDLAPAEVLAEGAAYGLLRYVPSDPMVVGSAAAARFYRRHGVLLALAHCLKVTDAHFENVIANGEHPVLIDLEAMLYPHEEDGELDITWTGLVGPGLYSGIQGGGNVWQIGVHESGGLHEESVRYRASQLVDANRIRQSGNSAYEEVSDYLDELVWGFRASYEAFVNNKTQILELVTARLNASTRIRFLVRPTAQYALLRLALFQPQTHGAKAYRSGVLRELDTLSYFGPAPSIAVLEAERFDLLNGDVPYFWASPQSCALHHSTTVQNAFFSRTPIESLVMHFARLGPADMALQEHCLRVAIMRNDGSRLRQLV